MSTLTTDTKATAEALAREIIALMQDCIDPNCFGCREDAGRIAPIIQPALDTARADGIEAAAKECDAVYVEVASHEFEPWSVMPDSNGCVQSVGGYICGQPRDATVHQVGATEDSKGICDQCGAETEEIVGGGHVRTEHSPKCDGYTCAPDCPVQVLCGPVQFAPALSAEPTAPQIERVWEMPNKYTFKMRAVASLLAEEMSGEWADPFCGIFSPASLRNDADESREAESHVDGLDFLRGLADNSQDGVLFDPPYSTEQALRKYKPVQRGTAGRAEYWAKCKDEIMRIVKPGGKAICFAWDSNGIGKKRGFTLQRILLLCHGACHNDTIITIETKR